MSDTRDQAHYLWAQFKTIIYGWGGGLYHLHITTIGLVWKFSSGRLLSGNISKKYVFLFSW